MSRPTWSEVRNAVRCRACKAAPTEKCRSLLDRPLNACHPARVDDAISVIDYLEEMP